MTGVKRLGSKATDDGMWRYVKAGHVVHELGHSTRTVDILRLDLHGGEWDVLHSFATAGTLAVI